MPPLVRAVPLWTGAAAVYRYSAELKSRFTWTDRFGEQYEGWREVVRHHVGRCIDLPREACPLGPDRRCPGVGISTRLAFRPKNAEQARVVSEAVEFLDDGLSGIIQASTGFGKTYVGASAVHHLGRKALVVVTKDDMVKQWRDDLCRFLSLTPERIGLMRQNRCDVVGKDVVIGMLHSLAKDDGRWPDQVMRQFGLVVFDEVHRLPATEFVKATFQLPALWRLGLSATPERKDGKDALVRAHVGPVRVQAQLVPMAPKVLRWDTKWRVPRDRQTDEQIPHSGGRDAHVQKIMMRNVARNRLVCHAAQRCHEKGRHVVVFTKQLDHLECLEAMLREFNVPSRDVGRYVGGMKEAERDEASVKPVVLATYGMASYATNYPWWDACVLATPMADVQQAVGRILREHEGKRQPVVIDLMDRDSNLYRRWAEQRERWYTSDAVGGTVVDLERPRV